MYKNLVIIALVAVIAVGGAIGAFAATQRVETEASVDVTVWKSRSSGALYLSTRPTGGSWVTHNTPLDLSQVSSSGRFNLGSPITVAVPVTVEVDVPSGASEPSTPATPPPTTSNPTTAPNLPDVGTTWLYSVSSDRKRWAYVLDGTSDYDAPGDLPPFFYVGCTSNGQNYVSFSVNARMLNSSRTGGVGVGYSALGLDGEATYAVWASSESERSLILPPPEELQEFETWLRQNILLGNISIAFLGSDDTAYAAFFTTFGLSTVLDNLACWN